jgi:hypothetical protein
MPVDAYPITIEGETAHIATAAELVVALDVLHGQHDRAVLEQLRPHLADVLGGPAGLFAALKALEPADQLYLIDAVGPRLTELVARPGALRDILATLADAEVEERLLRTLGGEGLRKLVRTPEELAEVLEWVYAGRDGLVLELLGLEFLARLLQTGYELSIVLRAADEVRQQELLEGLGWQHVVSLVQDDRDLGYLLRALPPGLGRRLIERFSCEQLRDLIRDEYALESLDRFLEADEAACLRERMEGTDNAE